MCILLNKIQFIFNFITDVLFLLSFFAFCDFNWFSACWLNAARVVSKSMSLLSLAYLSVAANCSSVSAGWFIVWAVSTGGSLISTARSFCSFTLATSCFFVLLIITFFFSAGSSSSPMVIISISLSFC